MTAIIGKHVRLEKLVYEHIEGLCECLLGEPDGWFARMYNINSPEAVRAAIEKRLQSNDDKNSRSFVLVDQSREKVAGISHFMKIDSANRQLEIGGTQVGRYFRRTYVNTETKLLMLAEAFENMNCVRVYFKVDKENIVSQKAMERLGVHLEGCFRNDAIAPNGQTRSYFVYSVIDAEWPKMRDRLTGLLVHRPTLRV